MVLRQEMIAAGEVASIHVPIATEDVLLGILTASVRTGPHRLKPSPDLLNRLSGVAAQATTALQNGRLVVAKPESEPSLLRGRRLLGAAFVTRQGVAVAVHGVAV